MKQVMEGIEIKSYMELKRTIRNKEKWTETSNIQAIFVLKKKNCTKYFVYQNYFNTF